MEDSWSFIEPSPKTHIKDGPELITNIQQYLDTAKPNIVILTPCYNSSMYAGYTESLLKTMFMCKDMNIPATVFFCRNDSLVSRARNNLIAKAMYKPDVFIPLKTTSGIRWSKIRHSLRNSLNARKRASSTIWYRTRTM